MSFDDYWTDEAQPRLLSLEEEFGIKITEDQLPVFQLLALRSFNAGHHKALQDSVNET